MKANPAPIPDARPGNGRERRAKFPPARGGACLDSTTQQQHWQHTVVHADQLLPHMRRVQVAERDLCDLSVLWQMIETSAAISCPEEVSSLMPTLVNTRERFDAMRTRLVDRMVDENRAALGDDLGARAQCAIDILVRNLYERTADVGFLATDGPVSEFCAADAGTRAAQRESLRARLREYQAKYTVYDDIALLATDGEVLLRLDERASLARSTDPIAAQALAAGAYVEAFGPSDLGSSPAVPCLRYAHRIVNARGQAVGVLVLRFRFADEMERIFADVSDAQGQIAIVLLDDTRRVIVSNDEAHVPLGARFAELPLGQVALTTFAGREYLAVCCTSQGYQGYAGPRWRALAMVSLLTAFNTSGDTGTALTGTQLASGELSAVERDADAINRELRRVIWNGRLMTGQGDEGRLRLKAVLRQVSLAGVRTRRRLEGAIVDLSATSFGRACRQAQQLARLAADLMDRNLYERANDCRWWALSPVLRRELAGPDSAESRSAMNGVLDHINGLYTVYSRLVAFDTHGVIRGASRAGGDTLGSHVPEAWLQRVRGLQGSQQYAVSDFGPTALHDNGDTYVYLAAVRAEHDERMLAGGVAIVFNAARELSAMLADILGPRSGHAAFVDASGRVLAATHPELAARVHPQGTADTHASGELIDIDGVMWACAASPAGGYREFKKSDGYDNQVRAVVGLQIGTTERRGLRFSDYDLTTPHPQQQGDKHRDTRELAVFQVGGARYALDSDAVLEVVSTQQVVRAPGAAALVVGMLPLAGGPAGDGRAVPVVCARRLTGITQAARATDGVVLLLRRGEGASVFGLRVDDVLSVIEVAGRDLHPVPAGTGGFAASLKGLVDCRASNGDTSEKVLVQLLDAQRLAEVLGPAPVALAA
jgi:chemotaxis signal transduction protein